MSGMHIHTQSVNTEELGIHDEVHCKIITIDKPELRACCERCENYAGLDHDYSQCSDCPTFVLYEKYEDAYRYKSWSERPEMMGR